jgi:uncharacterized protein
VITTPGAPPTSSPVPRRFSSLELLAAGAAAAIVFRPQLVQLFQGPAVATWATMFVSLTVQALPFLVLGVVISGAIAVAVPPGFLARALPRHPGAAVPMAGLAGALLPGCECGSVPIAGRLVARGAPPPAALAFMLAAPAINPVVLVATAVAFPGRPEVVAARFLASLATAVVVGLGWARLARPGWTPPARDDMDVEAANRWEIFAATARHDFGHAGGFLVLGAAMAATLQTVIPRSLFDALGGSGPASVLSLGVLAVVLAVCSEADAFVAASLTQFSPTARLAFMVVGPVVDVKLVALQAGTFGRAFAVRFAPAAFAVAMACAAVVGWWLL